MTFRLTWLPSVLRLAGLEVVEQPGWQTRGHGDMQKPLGVICHHTAECRDKNVEPALKVITEGRPGLKGPLCNLGLGQGGTYWMVAAGIAHHAGPGKFRNITKGNTYMVGIEAENDGIGEPWPKEQMIAYAKGCAAIANYCKFTADFVIGHKEWAPTRKIDPTFNMTTFRLEVAHWMEKLSE